MRGVPKTEVGKAWAAAWVLPLQMQQKVLSESMRVVYAGDHLVPICLPLANRRPHDGYVRVCVSVCAHARAL